MRRRLGITSKETLDGVKEGEGVLFVSIYETSRV